MSLSFICIKIPNRFGIGKSWVIIGLKFQIGLVLERVK